MASYSCFILVVVVVVMVDVVLSTGANRHITRNKDDRYGDEIRALQRRLPDCRELFESCRGVPTCCGDLQCFWEDGFSALKDGQCVSCVDRSQTCQRDEQCCENTVCQTDNPWDVNGVCELKKTSGEQCYRDAQCSSNDCNKSWYEVHGSCR